MANKPSSASSTTPETSSGGKALQIDDSKVANSYANICNVSSTQEEMAVVFGINQAWDRQGKNVEVQLHNRIIMSPHTAKRLARSLGNVLERYEKKYGALTVPSSKNGGANGG